MRDEKNRFKGINAPDRRYDIDWIRVLAVYLLIPFHTVVVCSPFGISFIKNNQTDPVFLGTFVGFVHQ